MARQQRAIETRARIVSAASECFSENGYRATRIADILERAHCTAGAFLFHFPAKADIANEVIDQQHRMVMQAAVSVSEANSDSGIEDIVVVSAKLAHLIAESAVVRAGLRLSTESLEELGVSTGKPYLEWVVHCTRLLEKARGAGEISADIEIRDLAEVIVSAFTGTQYLSAAVSGSADLPERLAKLWPILFSRVSAVVCTDATVKDLLDRHSIPIASVTEAE